MADWQLAQLNIAQLQAPIDSPTLADFVANLDRINELAESSAGFVWRLKGEPPAELPNFGFDPEYINHASQKRMVPPYGSLAHGPVVGTGRTCTKSNRSQRAVGLFAGTWSNTTRVYVQAGFCSARQGNAWLAIAKLKISVYSKPTNSLNTEKLHLFALLQRQLGCRPCC